MGCNVNVNSFTRPLGIQDHGGSFLIINAENLDTPTIFQRDISETDPHQNVQDLKDVSQRIKGYVDEKTVFGMVCRKNNCEDGIQHFQVFKEKIEQLNEKVQKVRLSWCPGRRIIRTLRNQLPEVIEGNVIITGHNINGSITVAVDKKRDVKFKVGNHEIRNDFPLLADVIDANTLGKRYTERPNWDRTPFFNDKLSLYYRALCAKDAFVYLVFAVFSVAQPIFLMYQNWDQYKAIWKDNWQGDSLEIGFEVVFTMICAPMICLASAAKSIAGAVCHPSIVYENNRLPIEELPYKREIQNRTK